MPMPAPARLWPAAHLHSQHCALLHGLRRSLKLRNGVTRAPGWALGFGTRGIAGVHEYHHPGGAAAAELRRQPLQVGVPAGRVAGAEPDSLGAARHLQCLCGRTTFPSVTAAQRKVDSRIAAVHICVK